MTTKELRSITTPAQVEKRQNGSVGKIFGYAAVFNSDSEDMGFIERIAPGAFKSALRRSDVRALKNHNPDLIFGRKGRNLKLKEDDKGLYYEASPVDTRVYRDTAEEIASGLLTGQSFSFTIESEDWSDLDKDRPKRTITKVREIFDVGPVTYPAYMDTTVALRSLEAAREQKDKPAFEFVPDNIIVIDNDREFVFEDMEQVERVFQKVQDLRPEGVPTNAQPEEEGANDIPTNETVPTIGEIEQKYDLLTRRHKK